MWFFFSPFAKKGVLGRPGGNPGSSGTVEVKLVAKISQRWKRRPVTGWEGMESETKSSLLKGKINDTSFDFYSTPPLPRNNIATT